MAPTKLSTVKKTSSTVENPELCRDSSRRLRGTSSTNCKLQFQHEKQPPSLTNFQVEAGQLEDDFIEARASEDKLQLQSVFVRAEELQSKIKTTQIAPHSHVQLSLLTTPDGTSHQRGLSISTPSGTFDLHEAARCSAEIFRYALHIFVHRIIHGPLSNDGQCSLVQEAISESLRILPIIPDVRGPGNFLGWALVVIGAEIDVLDQREFITRRLESLTLLSVNHGVLPLKVLNEVWRRRDDLKLGLSLSQRVRWQDVMHDMEVDQALV